MQIFKPANKRSSSLNFREEYNFQSNVPPPPPFPQQTDKKELILEKRCCIKKVPTLSVSESWSEKSSKVKECKFRADVLGILCLKY